MQPQQVQDPRLALEGQKLQQQAQIAQQKAQVDGQKLQLQAQEMQTDAQLEQMDLQARVQMEAAKLAAEREKQEREDARKAAELQAKVAMNTQDNATAMQLAAAEIATGERVAVETGTILESASKVPGRLLQKAGSTRRRRFSLSSAITVPKRS